MSQPDLSQLSMHELFRLEAESNTQVLVDGLLALERDPSAKGLVDTCMRAAHSLKGAARLVDIDAGVALAHAMEDFLVAVQQGRVPLRQEHIDVLLRGVDLMMEITRAPEAEPGETSVEPPPAVAALTAELARLLAEPPPEPAALAAPPEPLPHPIPEEPSRAQAEPEPAIPTPVQLTAAAPAPPPVETASAPATEPADPEAGDRALRVTVDNLNRLLGLAGESLVESRRLKPFSDSLLRLKRLQRETAKAFERLPTVDLDERTRFDVSDARRRILDCEQFLSARLLELDASDRRATRLAHRLYDQALACRMRPLADGTVGYPRLVRDTARRVGRQARLEISGASTLVDRDILERLDAPLGHLLRNAVDHGIEPPEERLAAGKPAEGLITIEARHSAGSLQIVVADDGRGVDLERLRNGVVARKLASAENAARLSPAELLEFLFLPGFTMKDQVTETSGRGVGLDVVQDTIRRVRGVVRVATQAGAGTRFHLQLPLTLSVVRTLLVEIGQEPYAFPLAYLVRAVKVPRGLVRLLEGREFFDFEGQPVGLVAASQILEAGESKRVGGDLSVIVIGDPHERYGLVVDAFLGGRELVLQRLDPRLGTVKDISAAALMEDGSPVLVIDVEDLLRSLAKLASAERLTASQSGASPQDGTARKRVLVVDDSLTVRELERKLLDQHGYAVDVAVDGMDGWNAARSGKYQLVVTDVDMPRMDGIELVRLIKGDAQLRSLPVMILSYKDREEDRRRGLAAGADYYLTKGSFHDDTLIEAVVDLIGEAAA